MSPSRGGIAVCGFAARSPQVCIDPSPAQVLADYPRRQRRMSSVAGQASWVAGAVLESDGIERSLDRSEFGVLLGVHFARAECLERAGRTARALGLKDYCDPGAFVSSIGSAVPGQVAMDHGLRGASMTVANGDAAGLDAVGLAFRLLRAGRQRAFLAGGVESSDGLAAAQRASPAGCGGSVEHQGGAALIALHTDLRSSDVRLIGYHTGELTGTDMRRGVAHAIDAQAGPRELSGPRLVVTLCEREGLELARGQSDDEHWRETLKGSGAAGGAMAVARALQWLHERAPLQKPCSASVCSITERGTYSLLIFNAPAEVGDDH